MSVFRGAAPGTQTRRSSEVSAGLALWIRSRYAGILVDTRSKLHQLTSLNDRCSFPAFAGQGFRFPPQLGVKAMSCPKMVSTRPPFFVFEGSQSVAARECDLLLQSKVGWMVGYNRNYRLVIQRLAHKLRYDGRQVSSNVTGLWRCRLNSKAARRSELPAHGYLSSVVVPS